MQHRLRWLVFLLPDGLTADREAFFGRPRVSKGGEMKKAVLLWFTVAAAAQPMLPRVAPEFRMVQPDGREIRLSSYRGNVVVLAFLSTSCSHCQAVSRVLQAMSAEFQGLQVLGAAFDPDADVPGFVRRMGLTYPVARVDRSAVRAFMGIETETRIGTPQIAVIDRRGMIRAQSAPAGSPLLQSPDVLRSLVAALLKKGATP